MKVDCYHSIYGCAKLRIDFELAWDFEVLGSPSLLIFLQNYILIEFHLGKDFSILIHDLKREIFQNHIAALLCLLQGSATEGVTP